MRNEQDIINLRAQYQEQLDTIIHLQREFAERLDLNSPGITREIEFPLKKVLELDIERLDWILDKIKDYPGPYYRTEKPSISFEEFCERVGRNRDYTSTYDLCNLHGTFEKGDVCYKCLIAYQRVSPSPVISLPISGVDRYAT